MGNVFLTDLIPVPDLKAMCRILASRCKRKTKQTHMQSRNFGVTEAWVQILALPLPSSLSLASYFTSLSLISLSVKGDNPNCMGLCEKQV